MAQRILYMLHEQRGNHWANIREFFSGGFIKINRKLKFG
jgi:hypothetical protein